MDTLELNMLKLWRPTKRVDLIAGTLLTQCNCETGCSGANHCTYQMWLQQQYWESMRWWRLNNVPPSVRGSGPRWHQKQRNPHERWHHFFSNLGLLPNYPNSISWTWHSHCEALRLAICPKHMPYTCTAPPSIVSALNCRKKLWDVVWCCRWFQGNQTPNSLKEQLETFCVAAAVYMMTDKIVDCRWTWLLLTHDCKYFLTFFCTQPNLFGLHFCCITIFFKIWLSWRCCSPTG